MNKKQKLLIAGAALFAALFLFSGIMLAWQYADGKKSADSFEAVAGLVQPDKTPQPGTVPGQTEDDTQDFDPTLTAFEKYAAVQEQNTDFVGWISIDGTNINYPVMQTIDNPNFYLKHGFEKQYSNYGVPYVQENCGLGISDNIPGKTPALSGRRILFAVLLGQAAPPMGNRLQSRRWNGPGKR